MKKLILLPLVLLLSVSPCPAASLTVTGGFHSIAHGSRFLDLPEFNPALGTLYEVDATLGVTNLMFGTTAGYAFTNISSATVSGYADLELYLYAAYTTFTLDDPFAYTLAPGASYDAGGPVSGTFSQVILSSQQSLDRYVGTGTYHVFDDYYYRATTDNPSVSPIPIPGNHQLYYSGDGYADVTYDYVPRLGFAVPGPSSWILMLSGFSILSPVSLRGRFPCRSKVVA